MENRYAATIAAGSYSVLTHVHPEFQLIVCIKALLLTCRSL